MASGPMREIVPLLQVGDMETSLEYYLTVLGFAVDFVWPEVGEARWAGLSRDGVHFMLTIDLGTSSLPFIAEKGNGVVFYVVTKDIQAVYDELAPRGAIVVQEIIDMGGRRQFSVADPNGYVLAFSEPFGS
jgi:uncharacterized glyoxalase superfamily protein PhnB